MNYTQYLNEAQNEDIRAWLQYQERAKSIKEVLKEIDNKLKKHAARAKSQPTNYGFSGDLYHVLELLTDVSDFLRK